MFNKNVKILAKELLESKVAKRKLKEEIEELKLKKRLEQEEITHMVRINEERKEQEVEKYTLKKLI